MVDKRFFSLFTEFGRTSCVLFIFVVFALYLWFLLGTEEQVWVFQQD